MVDESNHPTLRVGAVESDPAPNRSSEESVEASPRDESAGDETTDLLDRAELMRQVESDRDMVRQRKTTVRVDSVEPVTKPDRPSKTTEMPRVEQETTVEVERIDLEATDKGALDSTTEFARQGIGFGDGGGEMEFPVRIEEDLRIPLSAEIAAEIDLKPGDLVMVRLRKLGE